LYKTQFRRLWDTDTSLPDGLLSVGDACCSFNGQGMSSAVTVIYDCESLKYELVKGKSCLKARQIISWRTLMPFMLVS
jgi:hypothetical protein